MSIYEILCPVETLDTTLKVLPFPEILRVDIVCQQFYILDENSILYDNRAVRFQFMTVNIIMIINSRRHTENGDFDIIKLFSPRRVRIVILLRCRSKSQDNVPLSGIIVNK